MPEVKEWQQFGFDRFMNIALCSLTSVANMHEGSEYFGISAHARTIRETRIREFVNKFEPLHAAGQQ